MDRKLSHNAPIFDTHYRNRNLSTTRIIDYTKIYFNIFDAAMPALCSRIVAERSHQ